MKNKKKIVLFGSYGQGNIGDEELLRTFLKKLRKRSEKIYVNSSNPDSTGRLFNVETFSTSLFKDVIKKISIFYKSDVFIFGGGSVLIEHAKENLKWYHIPARPIYLSFIITLLGKVLRKNVIFAAIGIGPVKSYLPLKVLYLTLSLADEVIVRDEISYKFAKTITAKDIVLSSDVVLLNENKRSKRKKKVVIFPNYHLPSSKHTKNLITKQLVESINILNKEGWEVVLIPLWYEYSPISDKWYSLKILNKGAIASLKNYKSYLKISRELSTSRFCISMRLHGAIFSSITNTPFIAINYNPKVKGYVENVNPDFLVEIRNMNSKEILKKLKINKFSNREKNNLKILKARSEKTFEVIYKYL